MSTRTIGEAAHSAPLNTSLVTRASPHHGADMALVCRNCGRNEAEV